MDLLAESRVLTEEEVIRRREIRKEVWSLRKRDKWLWLQKSRLDWRMKGDQNTRYFHTIASCRQNRNLLNSITVEGGFMRIPLW
ncbi:hypothetical protein ACSBR1_014311 [Camellia fascicularis]